MAREKQIFESGMLAHVWASREQDCGRNASRGRENMYFTGATIYSYGSHFPMATFAEVGKMRNGKPREIILENSDSYSATTSGHQRCVSAAIPHEKYDCFQVSGDFIQAWLRRGYRLQVASKQERKEWRERDKHLEWGGDWQTLLKWRETARKEAREQVAKVASEFESAKRRRSLYFAVDRFTERALKEIASAFGLLKALKIKPLAKDKRAAQALSEAISAPEWSEKVRARQATQKEANDKREETRRRNVDKIMRRLKMQHFEKFEFYKMELEQWKRGERARTPNPPAPSWLDVPSDAWRYGSHALPCALRVNGEKIETSQGAEFPREHLTKAARYFKVYASKRFANTPPATFSNARLGHFHVDRFKSGGVIAGCHFVKWAEINQTLTALGERAFSPREQSKLEGASYRAKSEGE